MFAVVPLVKNGWGAGFVSQKRYFEVDLLGVTRFAVNGC
jgi:hypothetical protein